MIITERGEGLMLGSVTQKYESGNLGPKSISTGKGDPGGKSYGTYQLSLNTGTLRRFLNWSGFDKVFQGMLLASDKFDNTWIALCSTDAFVLAQHEFIRETHYEPLRKYATVLDIPDHPAINEALWSMSIQHGKASKIVDKAHDMLKDVYTTKECIQCLYQARCDYVDALGMPNLKKRYASELKDVLGML